MLRTAVIVIGVLLLAGSAIGVARGAGFAVSGAAILGVLLLVGTVFERRTYRKLMDQPPVGPDWQATGERFEDPASATMVEVWYNKTTGAPLREVIAIGGKHRRYIRSQSGSRRGDRVKSCRR